MSHLSHYPEKPLEYQRKVWDKAGGQPCPMPSSFWYRAHTLVGEQEFTQRLYTAI